LHIELLEGRCVPTTLTPTTFADGGLGSGSLRDAVLQLNADSGSADDTIQLLAGTYTLTLQNAGGAHHTAGLTGDLTLTQASHRWIIQGAGSSGGNATILDASQLQDRVFQVVTPGTQVVFQHLIIQGGLAQDNGADGAVAGQSDALGGGLLNNGGRVTLNDVVLQNNVARGGDAAQLSAPGHHARGGGIYSTGGALTLAGATLANNQVLGGLGGAAFTAPNHAGNGGAGLGGGLYATGGSLDISNSRIASNQATGGRGGDGFTTRQCSTYYCTTNFYGGTGGAGQGGGLYVNGGSLTLATTTLATNQATAGAAGLDGFRGVGQGGGLVNAGTLTVMGSTLSGNSASDSGGGIDNDHGTLAVSDSTLSGNTASGAFGFGGGIENSGTLMVTGSTLSGNTVSGSSGHGGGIYSGGRLTVSNSTLSGNTASGTSGRGGGIYGEGGPITLTSVTLTANRANLGGGGIDNSGTLTVSDSTLSGNSVTGTSPFGGGGGIENFSTLTVSNSTLSGDTALYGAGIDNKSSGSLTLTSSTVVNNQAMDSGITALGGGIYNEFNRVGGRVTVNNSTFSGNTHGGIYNSGTLTVSNSTFSGNTSGGINSQLGTLTVSNSTFSGNTGRGIYNDSGGTLTVSNSTCSGNTGGGIYTGEGTVTLTNVTLTANRADTLSVGGGLLVSTVRSRPVLHNTLIAGNFRGAGTTPDDVWGNLDPGGDNNLIGDGSRMTGLVNGVNGNQVGTAANPIDPRLGPLQDNGGPTKTHALLAGSPALNTGNPSQVGVADQRGVVRAGGVNIGAYQASASTFVLTVPDTVAAGTPFDGTVQAVDAFGQVAFGYTGTVTFRVTDPDPAVVLPPDYTFTAGDQGRHTFSGGFTLITPGMWTLTVADLANGLSKDVMLTVNP
jgi:hypothetical protein